MRRRAGPPRSDRPPARARGTALTATVLDAGDQGALDRAAALLRAGSIVVVPTDTVYGVAADPSVPDATARLFEVKRRPREVRVPLLVSGVEQALQLTTDTAGAAAGLMRRFWPGGLTIVVPCRPGVAADLGADDGTVGLRCPDHPAPLWLCTAVGPLATTSANRHGGETPPSAAEVARLFGSDVALVLDGGPCEGAPSTVVDCTGSEMRLVRQGSVPWPEVLAHYDRS